MIGGLKKTASALAIAAAAGVISTSAFAADLGGNCCADLEERVAELEATTARKGNRVVSLTVSGHVNESLLFWDDGVESGTRVVTNGFSMTRFRFLGSAKINADWSAGFLMEFGVGRTGMSYAIDQESGADPGGYSPVGIRHQALYVKSNTLGTLWMGHTTDAVDGLIDICLGCPITSSSESSLGWGSFIVAIEGFDPGYLQGAGGAITWSDLGAGQEGYYATRRNLLKYVSPSFAGFSLSASWGDADDGIAEFATSQEHGYIWNIALRYANEFNGVRVAAGAGYTSDDAADVDSWAIVGSMQHVPTGLYVAANYRTQEIAGCLAFENCDDEAWYIQVGIVRKLSSLGATTFWFQYGNHENGFRNLSLFAASDVFIADSSFDIWSFGINQKIDAAAMELYLTYWNISGDAAGCYGAACGPVPATFADDFKDLNVIMAGARIRF